MGLFSNTATTRCFAKFVEVLAAALTVLSVCWTALMFYKETPSRESAVLFDAWKIVTTMEGKRVSGGRAEALRLLLRRHESLAGIALSGAILREIDLTRSDLSLALLDNVRFSHVNLRNAVLRGANLRDGHFERQCDFTGVQFDRAQLQGAVLADSILVRATFVGVEGSARTSFNGADMRSSVNVNGDFPGANFDNANLSGAKMVEGKAENATFQRAILNNFRMAGTLAAGVQFQKSTGSGAVFAARTVLDRARFDASTLVNPVFEGVSLRHGVFFGANLKDAKFLTSDLSGADFTSADLSNAMICNSDSAGAIFTNATLPAAGLSNRCEAKSLPVVEER